MKNKFDIDNNVFSQGGRNPTLPLNVHIPDGEAHVMPDGKIYVYGSLDVNDRSYCGPRYVVAYSEDMKNWSVSGTSFDCMRIGRIDRNIEAAGGLSSPDPESPSCKQSAIFNKEYKKSRPWESVRKKIASVVCPGYPKALYAPDAIYFGGRYYLFYCLSDQTEGVAVSDSPIGPFGEATQLNCIGIDPAIFRDDDGQVYYYWGQFTGKGAKLSEDLRYILPDTAIETVNEREHFFHEGFSMRKRKGIYYAVFTCTERGRPTCLGYATSTSPLGPFTYRGIIIDNAGCDRFSWNNHGSIEEFGGQWYVFYHRSSRGDRYMRRLCIEPIYFNDDGTIPEVKMTSQGVGEPFSIGEKIFAFTACALTGNARLMPKGKENEILVDIKERDSAAFRYVRCGKRQGKIEIVSKGSATVEVWANDKKCGYAVVEKGVVKDSCFSFEEGIFELKCVFKKVKKFRFYSITLQAEQGGKNE